MSTEERTRGATPVGAPSLAFSVLIVALLVGFLPAIDRAAAAGLKTTFVKVSLENLKIGETYNIRKMANLPLAVYNTGEEPTSLKVEPTIPTEGELREGYEPIPDLSWVRVQQDSFADIAPGAAALTDVIVTVPPDERFMGRRFQAMIWSHTVGGGFIACGLKSEVLFSISREKEEAPRRITLLPTDMYATDVRVGQVFDVREKGSGATLKVFNPFDGEKRISVRSVRAKDTPLSIPEGYADCPDPEYLLLPEGRLMIPAGGEREVPIRIWFPERDEYRGGRYMFVVAVSEAGRSQPEAYARICVTLCE